MKNVKNISPKKPEESPFNERSINDIKGWFLRLFTKNFEAVLIRHHKEESKRRYHDNYQGA